MSSEQLEDNGGDEARPKPKHWTRALALLLVAIQFVPSCAQNPPVTLDMPAPTEIKNLLRKACYDCHSNQSAWPWYSKIAPISWWIVHHVEDGRSELNFSTWDEYSDERRAHLLHECVEEMRAGKMPLPSYTWMHAGLDQAERGRLLAWLEKSAGRTADTPKDGD